MLAEGAGNLRGGLFGNGPVSVVGLASTNRWRHEYRPTPIAAQDQFKPKPHKGQAGQAHTDVLGTLRPVNAGRILALLLWLHFSGRGSNPHSLTFRLQTETTASLGPLIRAETLERLHFFGNAHRHQQGFQPLAQDE